MPKLLYLDSSAKGAMSVTRPLTDHFAKQWAASNPGGQIFRRDLAEYEPTFLNSDLIGAFYTPEEQQTVEQKRLLKQSEEFLQELFDADTYVFGVPLYNFGVPAVFKAYIDLVVRVGKTFSYDGGVPKGLLNNKKLVLITASGADYTIEPYKNLDHLEPYVRSIMGFNGVTDITVVRAHGHDPETVKATSSAALKTIDALFQSAVVR